jgi:dTDP-4-amino-4,6-dideoxygalactose transaminase
MWTFHLEKPGEGFPLKSLTLKNRIYLSPPHINSDSHLRIQEVFDSNFIAPVGPQIDAFEKMISEYTGAFSAKVFQSATASLHLALHILGVSRGDEVITQSHTHIGGVNPILYCGAKPIFIDSEEETWNMDPEILNQVVVRRVKEGKKPKAIIPVHLYGMPAKMTEIAAIANKYNIPLVEDAAESLGSTYKGKHTGTFGDMGVLSFNGNKIITTGGGGALLTKDVEVGNRAVFLSTQAREDEVFYHHKEIGFNYRMSNVLAGLGGGQMKVLTQRVEQRRVVHSKYREFFQKVNQRGFSIEFQEEPEETYSNRWLTVILVDPEQNHGVSVKDIQKSLEEENIESRPLWKPMHMQPVFKEMQFYGSRVSENLFKIGLCLPSGSNLSESDLSRIFHVLDRSFSP